MVVDVYGEQVNFIISDNMPYGTKEHIIANADDSFTVLLNGKYNQETLRESAKHALKHIRDRDYEKEKVQQIELDAHEQNGPDRQDDSLPEWAVKMIWDLVLRTYAAEATAEYFRQKAIDRGNDIVFARQEDKWLYDI